MTPPRTKKAAGATCWTSYNVYVYPVQLVRRVCSFICRGRGASSIEVELECRGTCDAPPGGRQSADHAAQTTEVSGLDRTMD